VVDTARSFEERLDRLLAGSGLRAVSRAVEPGHAGMPPDASLMDEARLIVCLEGMASFQRQESQSEKEVQLEPGDGLFVAPRRWVRARPRQPYVSMGIVFYAQATRFYLMRGQPGRNWRGRPEETVVVPMGLSEDARAWCRQMAEPLPALAPERFLHHAFECVLILARELLSAPRQPAEGGKARASWLAACDFIEQQLHRPLSRKDVARHLAVHPNHLSRLFAEFCDDTFTGYLQHRRLERACLLLDEPRLNLAEIARLSGFASANYFTRVFRQHTGRTPTRFRGAGGAIHKRDASPK
jgi:AraC-like DNA-binding protein